MLNGLTPRSPHFLEGVLCNTVSLWNEADWLPAPRGCPSIDLVDGSPGATAVPRAISVSGRLVVECKGELAPLASL